MTGEIQTVEELETAQETSFLSTACKQKACTLARRKAHEISQKLTHCRILHHHP